ncbi:hemerythrin domain-containing protein [Paenibacillus caseinilyticus]|uniref:Hemerythrin n=1 Tax=Paenibacillus mucilaginosus K02 TaxID=997761 RepID=I0BTH4_9BACL|nr:hemerythrin domain-containing protein [Paenibacillus mucilaginosus]AFH65671.1 hemerythrin [Paenibacillus mucilaginosus K02]
MKTIDTQAVFTTLTHPLYQLTEAIDRLKEEHALLEEKLVELYAMARTIGLQDETGNWTPALLQLGQTVKAFWMELEAHSKWEEATMFPMITWYFGETLEQFTLMEQEHELAEQYILAFIEPVERLTAPVEQEEAKELASMLVQAYAILRNHFRQEEEIIDALADRSNHFGGF